MPPSGRNKSQQAQLAAVRPLPSTPLDDTVVLHLKTELKAQKARNAALYNSLRVQRRQYQRTFSRLQSVNQKFKKLKQTELLETDTIATEAIQLLDNVIAENAQLQAELVELTQKLANTKALNASMHKERTSTLDSSHKEQLHTLRAHNRNLKKVVARAAEVKDNTYKRGFKGGKKAMSTLHLVVKGVYTPRARLVARTLMLAGCATKHIGLVIRTVCHAAGITVKGNISGRTAARSMLEGGIAAKIQIGHDLGKAKGE